MSDGSNTYSGCIVLEAGADAPAEVYGACAAAVVNLMRSELPVPKGWAFSVEAVRQFMSSTFPEQWPVSEALQAGRLVALRPSAVDRSWGGPETLLNIGMNWKVHKSLAGAIGPMAANALYFRFVHDFAVQVERLDSEDFEEIIDQCTADQVTDFEKALELALALYQAEADDPFPQDPEMQLRQSLRSMISAWNGTSARILRETNGAPADAGLGLIVQEMVLGVGNGEYGSGIAQFTSPITGEEAAFGRYLSQSQGRAAMEGSRKAQFLAKDSRGISLEDNSPEAFKRLRSYVEIARGLYKDEMQLEFTVEDGEVWILDAIPADRNGRAGVSIVVRLQESGLIGKEEALLRVDPKRLNEILHPQIDPKAKTKSLAKGIGASPGAALGKIVFSSNSAVASEARGEASILVRVETTPDDVRGMHAANGVLTERGGINSHAAVVARTLGVPCVVGAQGISIDLRAKAITLPNGEILPEGTLITLDGETGEIIIGATKLVEPDLAGDFKTFMGWADQFRKMGVRGNADTPQDVRMAQAFGIDGIGLVRTEHMFFDAERLTVMRELIFADKSVDRQDALNLLLPMQRGDFFEIFALMKDQPVCIRLLDPPLHEFLPTSREQVQSLAEAMNLPLSKINSRIEELSEFNPMLGTRGVRLGITVPEIYEMQARAIFEAACDTRKKLKLSVKPEIMVPLVSANREVELVKSRIDAVASAVQSERGVQIDYVLGVMVETPRAALRAQDIARTSDFMSFGTNDLTQMTYGLSRDDAGRFMSDYVRNEIFSEDPFLSLDLDGVGELLKIAAERGRKDKPNLQLGLCGEHGGDPDSVNFCHFAGFDYVSCSPFRTPIARLAAAQAAIRESAKK